MKNKLHIFGDSNSLPFFGNAVEEEKYKIYKGGVLPKAWMEMLSESLNTELVMYSEMGNSNPEIFQKICNNINCIKKNDIVIIGWTFRMRYQVISKYDVKKNDEDYFGFSNVIPSFLPNQSLLSKETMEELLIHKSHPFWVNEIYCWDKIIYNISKLLGFELFFWSFDDEIGRAYTHNCLTNSYLGKKNLYDFYNSNEYKNLNLNLEVNKIDLERFGFWRHIYNLGMRQINEETNGLVSDGHMCENGHKILHELFKYEISVKCKYLL